MTKDFYERERDAELRRIRKNQRQAAVREWLHNVSQLRDRLHKKIVDPILLKHDYRPHPEVAWARQFVDRMVTRILSPISAPLPLETLMLLGDGRIDDNGFLEPHIGFIERHEELEVTVQHGTAGEITFDVFDVEA